ncbi:MAG: hypothetical protein AAF587_13155 [Bacteroidota bacterium]
MIESIQTLRTEGNLEEALALATEYLQNNPDDEDGKREMAWIQYGYVKKAAKAGELEAFHNHLDVILAQKLEGEGVMGNSLAWQVHRVSKALLAERPFQFEEVVKLLEKVKYFTFDIEQDIMAYVMMLRLALKVKDYFRNLKDFIQWWDLSNLPETEYESFMTKQGRRMMSLAERAHITYADALLEWMEKEPEAARSRVEEFFKQYEDLLEKRPDYNFARHNRVNFHLALGHYEEVERTLLPIIKSKPFENRNWLLLGKLFEVKEQPKQALACYAKILAGRIKPDVAAETKWRMGRLLYRQEKLVEAKTELLEATRAYEYPRLRVPDDMTELMEQPWFEETEARYHNRGLYKHYMPHAEAILYSDIPEQLAVVTHVDPRKKRAWFRASQEVSGSGTFQQFQARIVPGDFVALRLEEREARHGGMNQVILTSRKSEEGPENGIIRYFTGRFTMRPGQSFGFVDREIFVPPHLVEANTLIGGQFLSGMAVLEYDQKRDRWSWKAVKVGGEGNETQGIVGDRGSSYDRDRDRDRGGYDRDRDRGGYDRDRRGGYDRDRDRGGYDRDRRGGYDRDRGSDRGYGGDRDRDRRGGGYDRDRGRDRDYRR